MTPEVIGTNLFVGLQNRSLLTEIGSAVAGLEQGLGVTALEDSLDKLLGGSLTKVCTP